MGHRPRAVARMANGNSVPHTHTPRTDTRASPHHAEARGPGVCDMHKHGRGGTHAWLVSLSPMRFIHGPDGVMPAPGTHKPNHTAPSLTSVPPTHTPYQPVHPRPPAPAHAHTEHETSRRHARSVPLIHHSQSARTPHISRQSILTHLRVTLYPDHIHPLHHTWSQRPGQPYVGDMWHGHGVCVCVCVWLWWWRWWWWWWWWCVCVCVCVHGVRGGVWV